jgi:hypothetical protein
MASQCPIGVASAVETTVTLGHLPIGSDHFQHLPITSDHFLGQFVLIYPTELIEGWFSLSLCGRAMTPVRG